MEPSAFEGGASIEGRYRIVRRLGKGAMGAVYEAFDDRLKARRAVKLMLPELVFDDDLRARFEREAQVLGSIDHPNVLRLFDAGVFEGMPYLVMEMLDGETLEARLERQLAFSPSEALWALRPVASALDRIAVLGLVHRDVKPENIFAARSGEGGEHIKLLDFGASKRTIAPRKTHTLALGTPYYMAPEQFLGEGSIGPAADRYALAHVAFTLLVGEPYWTEETKVPNMASFMASVLKGPSEAPSVRALKRSRPVRLPSAFDPWFGRATAVDPRARFESATEMIDALARLLAPLERPPPPASVPRRRWLPAALLAGSTALGLSLSLGAYLLLSRGASSKASHRGAASTDARSVRSHDAPPASVSTAPSTIASAPPANWKTCMAGCTCHPAPVGWEQAPPVSLLSVLGERSLVPEHGWLTTMFVTLVRPSAGAAPTSAMVTFTWGIGDRPANRAAFVSATQLQVTFMTDSLYSCARKGVVIWSGSPPFPPPCDFDAALGAARAFGYTKEDASAMLIAPRIDGVGVWQFIGQGRGISVDSRCHAESM